MGLASSGDAEARAVEAVSAGPGRDQALARIGRLDCADKALASCNTWPARAHGLQPAASDADYRRALDGTLKWIVCAGDDDSIFVLRGVGSRLAAAGAEAPALIDFIMSPACPVSAKLTDNDRARLQKIKQEALK